VNVTFRCDNDSNGLIGDNHAVGVARIDLLINIDKVEVNYSANYSGARREVQLTDDNESVAVFNWSFTSPLDLAGITLSKEGSSASKGYVIMNGLNVSKVLYVDRKQANSSKVCVKDSEVSSISGISAWCNGSYETLVDCPGSSGNYTCDISGNKFVVSGLMHSAVQEYVDSSATNATTDTTTNITNATCTSDWRCTNYSACTNYVKTRTCVDISLCTNATGKPNETEQCFVETENPAPVACTPSWQCTEWAPEICPKEETQKRSCTDSNYCGVLTGKPSESMTCTYKKVTTMSLALIIVLIAAAMVVIAIVLFILFRKKPASTDSGVIINRAPPSGPGNFAPMPPVAPGYSPPTPYPPQTSYH
jgi:hypothetical protein